MLGTMNPLITPPAEMPPAQCDGCRSGTAHCGYCACCSGYDDKSALVTPPDGGEVCNPCQAALNGASVGHCGGCICCRPL